MFFLKKNNLVDKSDALVGRNDPIENELFHEINGRNLMEIPNDFELIILGMGCFWGAEKIFWQLEGVYHTSVGYAGGYTKNPTYDEVCSGLTGHTEVVRVVYDPKKLNLKTILIEFWEGHDPTQGMRQGNDIGTQYRSAIFVNNSENINDVKTSKTEFQSLLHSAGFNEITTEIKNNVDFYFAETYHQQYLYKNPNGYCGLGGCGVKFN